MTYRCLILVGILALVIAPSNSQAATNKVSTGFARCTSPAPREGKAHDRFVLLNERTKAVGKTARVIFVGDSITEGWEINGREAWKKFYEPRHALNLGIGSDHTQHVLWRLENGNIDGLNPAVAVLLIGVNNVPDEGNSPADILAGITAVVQKLRSSLPETHILLLGIFPFRESFNPQRGKALQINQALERMCMDQTPDPHWLHYMDIGAMFINKDGRIPRTMMRDFLHPSPAAYEMWAEAMEPKLAELLGEPLIRQ